jgi:hypothetical protein
LEWGWRKPLISQSKKLPECREYVSISIDIELLGDGDEEHYWFTEHAEEET